MNWKNKRILVTGAGGFIASHLIEKLVGLNAQVSAFVRYNSRNDYGLLEYLPEETRKKITVIAGDLRDYGAIYDAAQQKEIIFHLAALIAIPYSYVHPKEVIETNILGTYNVLDAAKRLKIKRIIHTSTSEVYGTAIKVPISENHPLQGQSPYSASKIGADKIAESFHCSFGVPVVTVRPFNTYGPRQSARAIIPTIITQALRSNTIRLGSLSPRRDFTFVSDTVEGFVKAAESDALIGKVANLGSGTEISIGNLVKMVARILNKKISVTAQQQRLRPEKSEVMRLLADTSKMKKLTGWQSKVSLEKGLKETIAWIKSHPEFYKRNMYLF